MRNGRKLVKHITLSDPLSGEKVPALSLDSKGGLEFITIPDRALDIYRLSYQETMISHTNEKAGISPRNFTEQGTEGFAKNFFVGLLTTCGLCNAGRPCEENGHAFGLHGCISNTPCTNIEIQEEEGKATIRGIADEIHEDGVHMRLYREITADTEKDQIFIHDTIENRSASPQPYMMMYHINFGAPFLSDKLLINGQFSYIENRDKNSFCAWVRRAVRNMKSYIILALIWIGESLFITLTCKSRLFYAPKEMDWNGWESGKIFSILLMPSA